METNRAVSVTLEIQDEVIARVLITGENANVVGVKEFDISPGEGDRQRLLEAIKAGNQVAAALGVEYIEF